MDALHEAIEDGELCGVAKRARSFGLLRLRRIGLTRMDWCITFSNAAKSASLLKTSRRPTPRLST